MRRVVVTGIGMINSVGNDKESSFKAICEGECGIDTITIFDPEAYSVRIAGEVKNFDPETVMAPKEVKKADRFIHLGLKAAQEAMEDANFTEEVDMDRFGVSAGSGIGGLPTIEKNSIIIETKGPKRISPFFIPSALVNMLGGFVSIAHGTKGPNVSSVTACAAGTHAISDAMKTIMCNGAERMLVVSAESAITGAGIGGFAAMKALSTRNDDPKTSSRPFDADRDGFVMGEGATILASLLTIKFSNVYALGAILTLILFALIGFQDDYAKIKKNQNLAGLKARTKLALQILSALFIASYLFIFADFNTELYLPFIKTPVIEMGIFAILLWVLVIISTSNAVNLTDGLDGLATVPSMAALTSFSIIIYITGNVKISSYLLMPNFNVGEVAIVTSALMGALAGFLWYNCHPAEVFMGDSGSLTLGAFLGYAAIISKSEVLLLLIGSIFVIETLSVILQVGSFRLRKKRIFLMAPIHHHFEMKQWAENKIIVRFWIIAILSNLVALISLKIR